MVRGSLICFTYGKTAAWRLTIWLTVAPARGFTDSKETAPYGLQTSQTFHPYWRKASGIRLTASGAQENRWRIQTKSKYMTNMIVTRKSFYSKKKRDEKQVYHTHDCYTEKLSLEEEKRRKASTSHTWLALRNAGIVHTEYVWRHYPFFIPTASFSF